MDYRRLLKEYMAHVIAITGTDHMDSMQNATWPFRKDIAELQKLKTETRKEMLAAEKWIEAVVKEGEATGWTGYGEPSIQAP